MTSFQNASNMNDVPDEQDTVNQSSSARSTRRGKSASAFRTISEVAKVLGVQQHVLRFWETKFSQIRPLKRGGGRRYYRPEDMALLQKIHELLYTQGYTIKGVQKLLKEQGKNRVLHENVGIPDAPDTELKSEVKSAPMVANTETDKLNSAQRGAVESMLADLKELRDLMKG